ncbi:MAG: hypothetical protein ACIALR_12880 [Blastopirellula sp. JB062]
MSAILYNNGLHQVDWTSDVLRILLVRDTSTYVPNRDHDFLSEFFAGGGVEISVASYARQTLASKTQAANDALDQVQYDAADVGFGDLEAGQNVIASLIYQQVGGDDATPANDRLIAYDDGKIDVTLAADAASSATTLWVERLDADLPSGTALDFGGGATCTLSAAAIRGARELSVTALGAAADAGDVASDVKTTAILPLAGMDLIAVLQNGPVNIQIPTTGIITLTQKGIFNP